MTPAASPFAYLMRARQILLTTYRRSGEGVSTPVWFADRQGALYLYTDPETGKVKRLRRTSRVTIAPCTFQGTVTGPAIEARARIVTDDAERRLARRALFRKYWLQRRALAVVGSVTRLFSRKEATPSIYIAIEPAAP
jgi:PPOX class probable F420-dependent enzyme